MHVDIAEFPLRLRIVFFCEQANIVAQQEQALEQGANFAASMLQRAIVGQPNITDSPSA